MTDAVSAVLVTFAWLVLAYFLLLNTTYLVLVVLATRDLVGYLRRRPIAGWDDIMASPLTRPVTVIVPAHNEEAGIVESTWAMLALRYPQFEVIVIDDGSTDGTFAVLEAAFDLAEIPRQVPDLVPTIGEVRSVHVSRSGQPLTVVRKVGAGRKTDALNVGINASRYPLLCMVDADAVLDEEALLRVARPFVDDPERTVATGGVIRAANGCTIEKGRLVDTRMPTSWLARIQVVEYLRAFLLGRSGWSRLGGLLIISGAFGMFRRDLVVALGGYDHDTIGEDAELVARMHRHLREEGRDYRITFVAEPVCWTEVPESRRVLGRQRRRWSRGLTDVLVTHRRMIANPRYGRIGTVVLPYFVLFEGLGPVVELVGVVSVVVGLALGMVDVPFAVLFFLVAFGYGIFLSIAAIAIEDFTFRRYRRGRDLVAQVAAAVLENIGFRQLHAWWRLRGLVAGLTGREATWGAMERKGLTAAPAPERTDAA